MNALKDTREARCPACGHAGRITKTAPTTQKLRCRACGTIAQVRHCVGDSPCKWRPASSAAKAKEAAAKTVQQRYAAIPDCGDSLGDLWRSPTNQLGTV
jgi:hypothetical protein